MSRKAKAPPPSNFRKHLERLTHNRDTHTVFAAFVRLAACALSAGQREAEYMDEIKRWDAADQKVFPLAFADMVDEMEAKPFTDVLGTHYMEFALTTKGQQSNGEFHTPQSLCDLMAQIQLQDLPAEGPIRIAEPACGAGAMILAAGKAVSPEVRRRMRFTAVDVSRTACDMCFINTTLWGIPTRVVHGNTLSLETWGQWDNIHFIMPWLPLVENL